MLCDIGYAQGKESWCDRREWRAATRASKGGAVCIKESTTHRFTMWFQFAL